MTTLFTQIANHSINNTICSDFFKKVPEAILKHTDWNYSCQQTDNGCFLKPIFRNMPYRNSFVPEIDIVVSFHEGNTILHISGQPVKSVRIFMALWFVFFLMMEMLLLILAIGSQLDSIFPVFVPIGMCTFGYLLCKLATKATFNSVVNAIQREYA
ncbi:MAG: hypothetical protein IJZ80_02140 [Clostridia bacterium]|nr:hypothetical protein [Clostridia bacterium]